MKVFKLSSIFVIILILVLSLSACEINTEVLENVNLSNIELEIEKKYLIDKDNIPYDLNNYNYFEIYQTYINYSPELRVRKIRYKNQEFYMMAVKRYVNENALTREELDFYVTEEEYNNTVARGLDNTIHKFRYQIEEGDLTYCIDIFKDALEGLAYLEIEFDSEESANSFETPSWVIEDVTNDRSYKNAQLAQFGIPIKEN